VPAHEPGTWSHEHLVRAAFWPQCSSRKWIRLMTRRSGSADLPLHGGRVPTWLGERMTRLGAVISQAIVHHYGRDELLARLAHPFWFQSFGAVMGMDWHSSGITTSVLGALKRDLRRCTASSASPSSAGAASIRARRRRSLLRLA